ncbi:TonB-dependent receptor [Bowmanella yangjiangensis]|uniref:TonB-dependent receptor n=1 Tax=Bowmanella yangjiangensis TaxID=2811230 RepID=A0ABS3CRT8_9ALTE|nr:TonB-dependent receptor [Bowmanella yangjiangensis]MBN7819829.1 TonB-dependent receptor [Bowmanella yangjiangensis]
MTLIKRVTPVSLAVLAALSAHQTVAQDNQLERVTVTGSRIVESLDEVPASVTLIDQQTLVENLNVSAELQNLLALAVPGMAASTGSTSNFGQTLRGRNVLVMIDGVPQDTPLRNGGLGIRTLDAASIERIEVVNGATSIWGNGAAGGVINYITKKPGDDKANVTLSQSARTSLVKLEDSLGYRTVLSADGQLEGLGYVVKASQERYGVQRDADGDILGLQYGLSDSEQRDLFIKLNYQLDALSRVQLTYNYYDSDQDANYVDMPGNIDLGTKTYAVALADGVRPRGEAQGPNGNHNLMFKYEHDEVFANTALVVDAYQQKIDNVFFWSATLANPEQGFDGGQSAILSEKRGLRSVLTSRLGFDGVDVTLIYGADVLEDVTSQPFLDGRIWVPEMDMGSRGLFLQSKWELGDDWVVKAGARRESIDVEVDDYQTLRLCRNATTCSVPKEVAGGELSYNATTYNLGVRYNADAAFSPFVSYSEGYEVPDLGLLLRTATVDDINRIQSEASVVKNYEVGFSSQLDKLYLNMAVYRSTSELGTGSQLDAATGIYRPVRAPQKIWGYEMSAEYRIDDAWRINAAYGYTEGKDTQNDVYLGGRQISAPKLSTAVRYQPQQALSVSLYWLHVFSRDRFSPNADGLYTGDQGPIDAYDVLNLSASYQLGNWQVFGGVENLLNEDYFPARSQAFRYGSGYAVKGLGTTLNVGASYRF